MINGLLIVGASGFILYHAIHKLQSPGPVPGNTIMIVAGVGLAVNTGTALLFMKGREDLNIRGAFLHMAADAGVTMGVLAGGLVIRYTEAYWVDSALSVVIVAVILYGAWGLLSDSVKLAIDAVPKDIDLNKVKGFLMGFEKVEEVHDLHVWALSTTETALTVHLVIPEGSDDHYIFNIRKELYDEFGIDHCTIQVERTFADDEYRPLKAKNFKVKRKAGRR
jgi:cobalt-zinc-cadmium efflux system protein